MKISYRHCFLAVALFFLVSYACTQEVEEVTSSGIAMSRDTAIEAGIHNAVSQVINTLLEREKDSKAELRAQLLQHTSDFVIEHRIIQESNQWNLFYKVEIRVKVASGEIAKDIRLFGKTLELLCELVPIEPFVTDPKAAVEDSIQSLLEKLKSRQLLAGVRIERIGERRVTVVIPGSLAWAERQVIREYTNYSGRFELRLVASEKAGGIKAATEKQSYEQAKKGGERLLAEYQKKLLAKGCYWFPSRDPQNEYLLWLKDGYDITGKTFARFAPVPNEYRPEPDLSFELKEDRQESFGQMTQTHIGEMLGILFNGRVVSAPKIMSRISSKGVITGLIPDELALIQKISTNGSWDVQWKLLANNVIIQSSGEEIAQGLRLHLKLKSYLPDETIQKRFARPVRIYLVSQGSEGAEYVLRLQLPASSDPRKLMEEILHLFQPDEQAAAAADVFELVYPK